MRRRPRAQALLLEHSDTFQYGACIVHHRGLSHLLRMVDEERLGANARAAVASTVGGAFAFGAAMEIAAVAPRVRRQRSRRLDDSHSRTAAKF